MSSLLIFSKKSQTIPDCFTEGALDLLDDVLRAAEPEGEVEPETHSEPKGFDDDNVDEGIVIFLILYFLAKSKTLKDS